MTVVETTDADSDSDLDDEIVPSTDWTQLAGGTLASTMAGGYIKQLDGRDAADVVDGTVVRDHTLLAATTMPYRLPCRGSSRMWVR